MDTKTRIGADALPATRGLHTAQSLRRTLSYYDLVIYGIA